MNGGKGSVYPDSPNEMISHNLQGGRMTGFTQDLGVFYGSLPGQSQPGKSTPSAHSLNGTSREHNPKQDRGGSGSSQPLRCLKCKTARSAASLSPALGPQPIRADSEPTFLACSVGGRGDRPAAASSNSGTRELEMCVWEFRPATAASWRRRASDERGFLRGLG